MQIFYWTHAVADRPKQFFIATIEQNFATEVPPHEVGPNMLLSLLSDGFIEVSADTAAKMGLPT